ncbi:DNA-directed RNA polymerase subunit delta [Niallia nealsonii]|uniref:Probable DNA-directed RNA polymerase subunit delta n=1 Tax=Niallia nealsonii TaxID=115979 RepID=A0A2N0YZA4_9BACI|nr:DNA-directed RNA polymerase subunit delta [Niallia nealsonii]PKG22589.1 DNA-directed RNA polymerase subunit delta [Niallia nealsonii]
MSVEKYTMKELKEMSLIEVAYELLNGAKTPYSFHEIVSEVTKLLDLADAEVDNKIAQFYTDINIDGRFLSLGDNRWGLRTWYPVDKSEEDVVTVTKPKKKKSKKASDDDFDDFDLIDEEDVYDDFDEESEEDDDLLEDDDEEEEEDDDLLDDDLVDEEEEEELELDEEYDLDEEEEEEDDEFEDEVDDK